MWRETTIIALNYKEDNWPLGHVAPEVSLANPDDNAEAGAILSSFITPKRCYKIEDLWDALPAWEQKLAQLLQAQEPISELMKRTALLRFIPHQTELDIIGRPDLGSFRETYAFVKKHMEHFRGHLQSRGAASMPAQSPQMRLGKTPQTKILGGLPLLGNHICTTWKEREKAKVAVKAAQRAPIETGPHSPANAISAENTATDDMNVRPKAMDNPTKVVHQKVKATRERPRAKEKVSTLRALQTMALHLSPQDLQLRTIGGN